MEPIPGSNLYGVRHARWEDTKERVGIATINGEPVGLAPSHTALHRYAEEYGLEVVSREFLRDLIHRSMRR